MLFEGSVAENIARMATPPDDAAVVEAAKRTGAHEMILKLPGGYGLRRRAGRRRAVADRLQTLGERAAKVETQLDMALRGGGAAQMHDQFARDNSAIADRLEAAQVPYAQEIAVAHREAARRHAEQAEALRR